MPILGTDPKRSEAPQLLKRIQELRMIGCFEADSPASAEFDSLTFVFGENCYGKSTLCDVLRSVEENRPVYVTERLTVPRTTGQRQRARLTFQPRGKTGETHVCFRGGRWSAGLPGSLKLHIFDTEFTHRNVFTGLSIERQNQENITNFVLGEEGVAQAVEISDLKKKIAKMKRELNDLESSAFEGIKDLQAFLDLQITESQDDLESRLASCMRSLDYNRNLLADRQKVINSPDPVSILPMDGLDEVLQEVNECLASGFEKAHHEAVDAVTEHVLRHTANTEATKDWLRKGLAQVATEACPFCGQPLVQSARNLLAAYRAYFDEAFDEFVAFTYDRIRSLPKKLANLADRNLPALLESNTACAQRYVSVIADSDSTYSDSLLLLEQAASELRAAWDGFQGTLSSAGDELADRLEEKKEALYASFPAWQPTALGTAYDTLRRAHSMYDLKLQDIVSRIREFKNRLGSDSISQVIDKQQQEAAELQLKLRRLNLQTACSRYRDLQATLEQAQIELKDKQEALQREQATYLENYFERINEVFRQLGTEGFAVSCDINRRGHLPTVQLTVSFKGEPIRPNSLKAFFSESDRRALALSVFWAKVESLSPDEKQDSIIVLDDPVTSFDDGRVDRTIRLLSAAQHEYRQIIVMSHYARFLKAFFERANGQIGGIRLLKIVRRASGSHIEVATPDDFAESQHRRLFKRVWDFAERRTQEDVSQDLRVFLETEVRSRFRRAIEQHDLSRANFRDLISGLYDAGVLTAELRAELDSLRMSLNPDHHTLTGRSHSDRVSLAQDVLDFVYERL